MSRNLNGIERLKKTFNSLEYEDSFILLFKNLTNFYDIKTTWDLVQKCSEEIANDYFLANYIKEFKDICKDFIIEKIILLNRKVKIE